MTILIIMMILIITLIYGNKNGIPSFLYHHIGDEGVSCEWFEEHLKIIKKLKMETITNKDIEIIKNNGKKISKNSIILTFDDGYYDNYKYAHQLLKKYNMKATLYLNTSYVEMEDSRKFKYLSWNELKEMKESGAWDIQLHSHRHMPIFVNEQIERMVEEKDLKDREIQYLYKNEAEKFYPIFRKRGEYSKNGIIIKKETVEKIKKYYISLNVKNEEKIKLTQKYIDEYLKDEIKYEDKNQMKERILEDLNENIKIIEEKLQTKPTFFCWPWGHKSKETIEILKKEGVVGFVTTKKGTNSRNINLDSIKRIELRKFTPFKFKMNLLVARNYFLGKIYQLVS